MSGQLRGLLELDEEIVYRLQHLPHSAMAALFSVLIGVAFHCLGQDVKGPQKVQKPLQLDPIGSVQEVLGDVDPHHSWASANATDRAQ